jgi:TonB family protein
MKGNLKSVTVSGVENDNAKDQIEVCLINLHETSDLLLYEKNENNIYYHSEIRPRFKEGKDEFYKEFRANLEYPDATADRGIEGVVQLRFVVDRWGNVDNLTAYENINAPDWITEAMVKSAKKAFEKIDQNWIPGKIDNVEVDQWMVLPVHFNIEAPYGLQILM